MAYQDFITIKWDRLPGDVLEQFVDVYTGEIEFRIFSIMKKWAPKVETWMKENAPWTDRTAAARKGLEAEALWTIGSYIELILSHSVDYGTYLEGWNPQTNAPMLNAGRWSIIEPALDHFRQQIWEDILEQFRK
jgi:hypothetical protein